MNKQTDLRAPRALPQTHTNNLGVAIRDALDLLAGGIETFDWKDDDARRQGGTFIEQIDASHGFSDLRIAMVGGELFRVTITREG
jgi:hypothetical protein